MIFIVTHLQQQQRSSKLILHPQLLSDISLGTANMGVGKMPPPQPKMASSHRKWNLLSSSDGRTGTGTVRWRGGRSGLGQRLAKVQFPEKRNLVT